MKRFQAHFILFWLFFAVCLFADDEFLLRRLNQFSREIDPRITPLPSADLSRDEMAFYFLKLFFQKTDNPLIFLAQLNRDEKIDFFLLFGELLPQLRVKAAVYQMDLSDLEQEYLKFQMKKNLNQFQDLSLNQRWNPEITQVPSCGKISGPDAVQAGLFPEKSVKKIPDLP
ncbi:MAG: hypothetical protein PHW04_17370 [Candidatus Wallbacteria bacterium]|nr:hypothetical protein [Candidatus Wallbacteria bacterium]